MGKNIYDNFGKELAYLNELRQCIIDFNAEERTRVLSDLLFRVKTSDAEVGDLINSSKELAHKFGLMREPFLQKIIDIEDIYFQGGIDEPLKYICDFDDIFNGYVQDDSVISYLIKDALVDGAMRYNAFKGKDFINFSVVGTCDFLSKLFKIKCQRKGIDCEVITFFPGFADEGKCYSNGMHSFNIVCFNGEKYLVDLSFKQFFEMKLDLLESIGCIGFPKVSPGVFALNDEARSKVALEILNRGYIRLEENTLKNYCDIFALSTRNAFYYLDCISKGISQDEFFKTDYTDDDYNRFLISNDNMTNHENPKSLTYVREVVKPIRFYK